jgi:hypothetical protein
LTIQAIDSKDLGGLSLREVEVEEEIEEEVEVRIASLHFSISLHYSMGLLSLLRFSLGLLTLLCFSMELLPLLRLKVQRRAIFRQVKQLISPLQQLFEG